MRIKILFNLGLLVLPITVLAMEQLPMIAPEERRCPLSRVNDSASHSFDTAVVAGNLAIVKRLLDTEITVDQKLERMGAGQMALHLAAECGHTDIIEELLRRGADINAQDATGQTPLFCAALHGRQAAVKLLLKAGADPNIIIRDFDKGINYKHLLNPRTKKSRSTGRGFLEIPIEFDADLHDSALKIALLSRSEHNIAIVNKLLAYGAEPGTCMTDSNLLTDPKYDDVSHWFRRTILREKPDHLCFEELTRRLRDVHPIEVKRGVACAAAYGRTSLLKELPHHLYRLSSSVKDIKQFLAPLYSYAFHIAALRGHDSTAAFLFPYASEKETAASCYTLKSLLQFATLSENQRNSYEKVLVPILLRNMDQDMQISYFGALPREIREMVVQCYTEQK